MDGLSLIRRLGRSRCRARNKKEIEKRADCALQDHGEDDVLLTCSEAVGDLRKLADSRLLA